MLSIPRHLEGSEQPDTPEDRETNRRHDLLIHEDELHDRGYDDHKIKPVKKGKLKVIPAAVILQPDS